jgi:[protein-PII] uridylyltransferase
LLQAIRDELAERRRSVRQRFSPSHSGPDVCLALATAIDDCLGRLYQQAFAELSASDRAAVEAGLAVVALGGYGRRETAPYSDVDLLFLRDRTAPDCVISFIRRMVRDIWDVGLALGQNVSAVRQAVQLARHESKTLTALLDSRLLFGSKRLHSNLERAFWRYVRSSAAGTVSRLAATVQQEHQKCGASVYLLEPDVKRSAGGLRDVHLIRWIGMVCKQTADLAALEAGELLGIGDAQAVAEAHAFLLRVRFEMHFAAGKASEVLTRGEQLRIAHRWGYVDSPSLLAVEQFMRDYFRHTSMVADALQRLLRRAAPQTLVQTARQLLLAHRQGDGVRVGPEEIVVDARVRPQLVGDLERVIELAMMAANSNVEVDRQTIEELRRHYLHGNGSAGTGADPQALDAGVARSFLALLAAPAAPHRAVRMLHKVGVLEQLIPNFEHVRGLLQFNAYHKYTVDEHTFIMLQKAEELADGSDLLARTYHQVARKDLLHLAILLHDLGKGFQEDHVAVGRRIAESVAERLSLPEADRQTVVFLVQCHLALSHLAFRRDTSDPAVAVQLAREVGDVQRLRMLYVLTAVDIMATGPENYTQWKADLLADLFLQTLRLFGDDPETVQAQGTGRREMLLAEFAANPSAREFIEMLPHAYLIETPVDEIRSHIERRAELERTPVVTLAVYHPSTETTGYTVLTNERIADGIFHKICGALLAHRLEVLSARIRTLADGTVLDQFEVVDTHHVGPPSPQRTKQIGATIQRVLVGELSVSDALWSMRSSMFAPKKPLVGRERTRVAVDDVSSESCTVIDVFTVNRRGLLYTLAKRIYHLGLSVQVAKVATYAEEVVDVFYVREADGKKIHRADRVQLVRDHLVSDIHRLATDPASLGL